MKTLSLFSILIALSAAIFAQTVDRTRFVNPFIGTGGHGHTFPGATVPFGMVQLSPDTRIDNWDGSSGYHYSDDIIYGFSHTHLSGTGIPDGCDILFMPTVGEPQFFAKEGDKSVNGYASKFLHANEKAEPGYYSVRLDDDGILAEMTATKRVGLHRYSFPKSGSANIILDLTWRDKTLDSMLSIIGKNRIEGFRKSSSWAKDQTVYYVAEFSKHFESFSSPRISDKAGDAAAEKPRPIRQKVSLRFKTSEGEQVLLKVAISYVSIEGARENLAAELSHWDFDKVRADAKAAWNKELSKIEVSGGTSQQTTNFYTALYHTMIHPNVFNDVDGRYKGHDGKIHQLPGYFNRRDTETPRKTGGNPNGSEGVNPKSKIQTPKSGEHYTVFSLWDTFRAAHPLYTIIDQKRTVDFINTFIRIYEQGGRLPVWELWGEETDTMIGYHAVSVIADAMAKGIKGFDYEKAYQASIHSARLDHYGLAAYKKRGYISMEDENESVSKTLEYAYDDACINWMTYVMTHEGFAIGNPRSEELFRKYGPNYLEFGRRARSFENLYDTETGFMRPRKNGGFLKPFAPTDVTFNYTEGNAWQYTFFVPQDPLRLAQLMGGHDKLGAKLDELFSTGAPLTGREQPDITGLIGQYAHGNEPSHHIAYLYNYARQPWKTQKIVRRILDDFYKPTPDGLIGNEDCGQMSAWYVLSASGFYPVAPGNVATYALGTPLFKQVKYHLENGRTFTINAPNVSSKNIYIKSAAYDGKKLVSPHLSHTWIMRGAVVNLEMTSEPAENAFDRFIAPQAAGIITPVPAIEASEPVFSDRTSVSIRTVDPQLNKQVKIHFTVDGNEPTKISPVYTAPFVIDNTVTVKAVAIPVAGGDFYRSRTAEARFHKKFNDWTVQLFSKYNRQYTGGGDEGLIDGIRGTTNFASGEWQGYQGQDFVAVIDLRRETPIRQVGGSFLQVARSWIWMPTVVEFEVSRDGVNYAKVAEIKTDVPTEEMTHTLREYMKETAPVNARYVRVKAKNLGKIPAWHPGAGFEAFIFVDEIFIR